MTTVAVKDGQMAADSLGCFGNIRRHCPKLWCVNDAIIGFCGNYADGIAFVRWYEAGADMENKPEWIIHRGADDAPDFSALVLTDVVEIWTEHFQPTRITDPFFAIGSGAMAALGAMHMGATAEYAIRVAMEVDVNTGNDVLVYSR